MSPLEFFSPATFRDHEHALFAHVRGPSTRVLSYRLLSNGWYVDCDELVDGRALVFYGPSFIGEYPSAHDGMCEVERLVIGRDRMLISRRRS